MAVDNKKGIVKTINRKDLTQLEVIRLYYKVIFTLYNINVTPAELAVITYTALFGTITTPPAREAFLKEYVSIKGKKSSKASLNNIIWQLQNKELLYKDESLKIRIIPNLSLPIDKKKYIFNINLDLQDESA